MAWTAPRTWVTGEVVTAAQMNTHIRDNFKALGRDASEIRHVGASPFERWYGLGMESLHVNTFAGSQPAFYFVPFTSPRHVSIDRLAFRQRTAGAGGSVARCGIYRATSATNIYPLDLIVDGGEFVATSTGMKAATVSITLEPDVLYWTVFTVGGGVSAVTIDGMDKLAALPVIGFPSTDADLTSGMISSATAYGALPSTAPTGATPSTANQIPMILARYSA